MVGERETLECPPSLPSVLYTPRKRTDHLLKWNGLEHKFLFVLLAKTTKFL